MRRLKRACISAAVIFVTAGWATAGLAAPAESTARAQSTAQAQSIAHAQPATTASPQSAAPGAEPDALRLDLSSPQATVRTFLAAMNRINHRIGSLDAAWRIALSTLEAPQSEPNGQTNPAAQPPQLREAARRLQEVLDKLGVSGDQLPNADTVARDHIGRYVIFPSDQGDYPWVWDALDKFNRFPDPDGRIALVAVSASEKDMAAQAAAPRWVFSARTIETIGALAESLGPLPPTHAGQGHGGSADHVLGMLGPTFTQTQWWQWGALLGCIFLGLAVGKAASAALRGVAKRFDKHRWRIRAAAVNSCAGPLNLAIFTFALAVGVFGFVEKDQQVTNFVRQAIEFLYLIAIAWLIYNLVDALDVLMHRAASRTSTTLDNMIVPLVRKALRLFVIVIFVLVAADSVFGIDITGWLAGLGIAGLAVSLAAQDSIKNLFGSLTVFFDKPFAVGDFITYSGDSGTVEEIGFRSTKLRLVSGHVITVPNMKWIDNLVENVSRRPSIRREMNVRLAYDTPLDKVEQAVTIVDEVLNEAEVIEEGGFDMENNPPRISLNELNADSLNIRAYYWYQLAGSDRGFYTWLAHCDKINRMIIRRFHDAGIEFALPTQSLRLANDLDRQFSVNLSAPETRPSSLPLA